MSNFTRSHISSDRVRSGNEISRRFELSDIFINCARQCSICFRLSTGTYQGVFQVLLLLDALWVYTGLPVLRVTQKQKALSWVVLNRSVPVNFFTCGVIKTIWGVTQTSCHQRPFVSYVHVFNYFVMSCPILRSFTFLGFGDKFSFFLRIISFVM